MKKTLTTSEIVDAIYADKDGGWSWNGAKALAEYLEQVEEDTGTEMELDVVAFRCDYTEYASLKEWASSHFGDSWREDLGLDPEPNEEDDGSITCYLNENTMLIEFSGGIIVADF